MQVPRTSVTTERPVASSLRSNVGRVTKMTPAGAMLQGPKCSYGYIRRTNPTTKLMATQEVMTKIAEKIKID